MWDSFVAVGGAGDRTADQIAANRALLINVEGHVGFGTDAGSDGPRDEFRMLDDFLYGRYLHGDWGKWRRSVGLGPMETVALVTVLQSIEARTDQLAQWCRRLLKPTVDTEPGATARDGDRPAT